MIIDDNDDLIFVSIFAFTFPSIALDRSRPAIELFKSVDADCDCDCIFESSFVTFCAPRSFEPPDCIEISLALRLLLRGNNVATEFYKNISINCNESYAIESILFTTVDCLFCESSLIFAFRERSVGAIEILLICVCSYD